MPATEEKVNTTLREVIGESVNQTQKKSDDKSSSQTESGKKPEFISGIDVSDLPDNMTKEELKGLLAKKGKLLEDGYQVKFKEVAEYKKEKDNLIAQGITPAEAGQIVRDAIANKKNQTTTEVKKELRREIDILKDEAPDLETRKGVERLEKIVMELSKSSPEYKELKERLDRAEKALGSYQNKTIATRVESLNEALDKLSGEKYDKDFIEKYRDKIIEEGKKYPEADVKKIIKVITDPDEETDAILRTKDKEVKKERSVKEKINANDSSSSGVTGSEKNIDVQKVSLKGLIRQVMTQKK
jgi:hypothetical protein